MESFPELAAWRKVEEKEFKNKVKRSEGESHGGHGSKAG